MATVVAIDSLREQTIEEQIDQCFAEIDEAWMNLNRLSMSLGWNGYFIESHGGWARGGFADQHDYRRKKGIGRSTWYRVIRVAERLAHLSKQEFLSMSLINAEQLSRALPEQRKDERLVRKAATMTEEDFSNELVIDQARIENKPVGEVYVTHRLQMKQAQWEVIEQGIDEWRREHGIENEAEALELMVAEYRERPKLVGFMTESIHRLAPVVARAKSAEELEELRALFKIHLVEMGEILRICCGDGGNR